MVFSKLETQNHGQPMGSKSMRKIRGTIGRDELTGNNEGNLIWGYEGDDYIESGEGNDKVWGGKGDDEIFAGADDDSILGGYGNDVVYGQFGNDIINVGAGDNIARGGLGNDQLSVGPRRGNNQLFGGWGDDNIRGGYGNDVLSGGPGSDVLKTSQGQDQLFGGKGADRFVVEGHNHGNARIMDFSFRDGDSIHFDKIEISSVGRSRNIITAKTIDHSGTIGQLEINLGRLNEAEANTLMEDLTARIN